MRVAKIIVVDYFPNSCRKQCQRPDHRNLNASTLLSQASCWSKQAELAYLSVNDLRVIAEKYLRIEITHQLLQLQLHTPQLVKERKKDCQ